MTEKNQLNLANLVSMVGDDPSEIRDLLDTFVQNSVELLAQLENAALFDDIPAWKRTAHRLRGAAANFGFEDLQALCALAEGSATPETLTPQYEKIKESVALAHRAIADTVATL